MKISTAEGRIMDLLWRSARPMAVEDVTEALASESGWTEGTVRTLMTRLKKKKALAADKEGRRLFYRPLFDREAWLHSESRNVVDRLFDGHLGTFVTHFSARKDLSPADVEALRRLVETLDDDR
ncbi:MAG: transcriptional repressor, CopY family [Caulobacteraceae bacterium]|nr:transcriptional repressor, CopY family [Caulobacteraceae bacterium]